MLSQCVIDVCYFKVYMFTRVAGSKSSVCIILGSMSPIVNLLYLCPSVWDNIYDVKNESHD